MKFRWILRDTDRHGSPRVYLRHRGRRIRLRAPEGSADFAIEYAEALKSLQTTAPVRRGPRPLRAAPGTLARLIDDYMAAGDFRRLSARTQTVRRQLLALVAAEPVNAERPAGPAFGDGPAATLSAGAVRKLRDRHADRPEAGNARVKALRQVFAWAMEAGQATANPARDVPYFTGRPGGFHTWTAEEVERFQDRHAPGSKARLALAILLYTGARRSDAVRLGRQHLRDGWLRWTEAKGADRLAKVTQIPVLPALADELARAPAGGLTFLLTEHGRPYSPAGFANWFRRRCDEAGLPHCSAHGLRKAGATAAADNGATTHQLMAIFGWTTAKQAEAYTRKANRRHMAAQAMHLIDLDPERKEGKG